MIFIYLSSLLGCSNDKQSNTTNTSPALTSISISPNTNITTSTSLLCIGTATDSDNQTLLLSYSWTDQNNNVLAEVAALDLTPTTIAPETELTCTVTVNDGEETATDSVTITVENSIPEISNMEISPSEDVLINTLLHCSATISDADEEDLNITYSWLQNGSEVGTDSSLQLSSDSFSAGDTISCEITASDGYGGTATNSMNTTITNSAPDVGSISINPENPTTSDTLECILSDIINNEEDELDITYQWSVNGEVQEETSSMLSGAFAIGDSVSCLATLNDGENTTQTDEATTLIMNSPTIISAVDLSPDPVYTNNIITANATYSDADPDQTISISYEWHVIDAANADNIVQTSTESTLDGSFFNKNEGIYVIATPSDGYDNGTPFNSSTLTVSNSAPIIDSVSLNPSSAGAGAQDFECVVNASDADGETPTITYSWSIDGTPLTTETSSTLTGGSYTYGQTISCEATPSDEEETGASQSASLSISNTVPVANSVTISPETLYTNDTLEATVVISDADTSQVGNLTATYAWHVINATTGADVEVQTGTSSTLDGTTYFDRDDEVYVIVTPNDGIDDGTAITSSSVSVSNTPPTSPTVEIDIISSQSVSSTTAIAGEDDLVCQITGESTDADSDTVVYTYEWFDGNGDIQQTYNNVADTSYEFTGTLTDGEWSCVVTPFDGSDYGPTSSSYVDVVEPVESLFVYGTIAGQNGWSAMTNSYGQCLADPSACQGDSFEPGTEIPGDEDSRGDSIVGTNLPEVAPVYAGEQSWWFKRGYDSAGSGTPYSPTLAPEADATKQGFYYKVAFKAADENGDDSIMAVVAGDPAGQDRASNYLVIANYAGNLNIQSYIHDGQSTWGGAYSVISIGLDPTTWHILEATMVRDGNSDYWTYSVDGVEIVVDEPGYFAEARIFGGYAYTESTRVKFQPKHNNYDASYQGFIFDELVTRTFNADTDQIVEGYSTGFE
ncbi:MAG: hypothetical protein CL916_09755 [Deltaproteobacteria bacterium]|nr:hypothetical protein [Deltaproteobacteria bacterium]